MSKPKIKFETIILVAAIIGLLAYLVLRNPDRIRYQLPEMDSLKAENIGKIEIQRSGKTITLEKSEGQWVIRPQDYPADPGKVDKIKSDITRLTLTDVISESESYAKYGLDKDNRIEVSIYDDQGIRWSFTIGKQAATYRHTYVKLENDKRVFHARDSFRNDFDLTLDAWRDKSVLKFDQNEIREIQLIKGDLSLVFVKNFEKVEPKNPQNDESPGGPSKTGKAQDVKTGEAEVWLLPDGRKGKSGELKSMIGDLSHLNCSAYLEKKARKDFGDPIYRIILKGNKEYTLEIFAKIKEEDNSYPAFSSENPYMFTLSSYQAERFIKKPEEIVE